jgi:hypothetical protein
LGCAVWFFIAASSTLHGAATTNLLMPAGDLWKYLDDGSNQGTAWRLPGFDDESWPEGYAQLGYGESDEETSLGWGADSNRYLTYYFRNSFVVASAESYTNVTLSVLRDDGVVVYINGMEVWRNNMPAGAITYTTRAVTNVNGAAENIFYSATLAPTVLTNGVNRIAVEVHQATRTSTDLSFDLQLTGVSVPPRIVRGPYLQRGSRTNVTVRWRTSYATASEVRYGNSAVVLPLSEMDGQVTTDHEIVLKGLGAGTRYYYSVGVPGFPLAGDASYSFVTAPLGAKPTRIWVIGDSGTADSRARAVYNAYRDLAGNQAPDVWLMLGDNAYGSGTDIEYQAAVFNMYPEFLRQTVAWSTIGNHETYSGNFTDFPFLGIFTQPVAGECGGVPSGTEKYYSFDYGNVHFVCLDAMTSDRLEQGPMCQWLRLDLAANTNLWLIAFWHHPPYTKGSHDSDWEGELVEMRQNALPILESFGVDLVLGGHSHCYERSFLIDGHYGTSDTLTAAMKKDGGSGRPGDTGPYVKPTTGLGANQGAVYVVAGSSGQATFGPLNHPAMYFSELQLGSLVLDIDDNVMQAAFLRETGAVDDYFTLIKGTVAEAFDRVALELGEENLVVRWQSRADRVYQVERATTLAPADWAVMETNLQGTGGLMTWSSSRNFAPTRAFFRVLQFAD